MEVAKRSSVVAMRRSLVAASSPADVIKVGAGVAGIEEMMRASGLYEIEELRPVRELWIDSRRKLGKLLRKIPRAKPGPQGKKDKERRAPYLKELARLKLEKKRAIEAQRVSYVPEKEVQAVYSNAKRQEILPTMYMMIEASEPFWYKERRRLRHQMIADAAISAQLEALPEQLGPFPLIYADPPWSFDTYMPEGHESHRMPEDHYPVLSDNEIATFQVNDQYVSDLAAVDAVLFLWCTSSNIVRALDIMERWGFEYKTQAVWDKGQIGTGLIFRNQHEVLLYGTRGKPLKPLHLPSSVFRYPRGKHSAKPPEIRQAIEQMYPLYDVRTRLEMFSRGQQEGWTCVGNEARNDHAAARVDQPSAGVGAAIG